MACSHDEHVVQVNGDPFELPLSLSRFITYEGCKTRLGMKHNYRATHQWSPQCKGRRNSATKMTATHEAGSGQMGDVGHYRDKCIVTFGSHSDDVTSHGTHDGLKIA